MTTAEMLAGSKGSLWAIASRLLPATIAVQTLSFVSSIALARTLGATESTDAYFLALSTPVLVYTILLAGTRLGAIPSLTQLTRTQPAEISRAASEIVSAVAIAALCLSVVAQLLAFILIPIVLSGQNQLHDLTRVMTLELIPYGLTGALAGVLGAVLAVQGKFVLAVIVTGVEPVVKTLSVLTLGHTIGAQSQVIGNLVGSLGAVLILWWCVRRSGIRLRLGLTFRTDVVRGVLKLSLPLVVAQTVLQVNPLIDRAAASGISRGSVTVLELGLRLFAAPMLLLSASLIAPLTATWSARLADDGFQAVRASFLRILKLVVLILPPLVIAGFVLRRELVGIFYSGARYSPSSVAGTADVMGMLLLGFPAQLLVMPLATLFVIHKDAVFPLKVAVANVAVNLTLDLALRHALGVAGIALSTSVTFALLCAVYLWGATRRWGDLGIGSLRRPCAISLASGVAVTGVAAALVHALGGVSGRLNEIATVVIVGVAVVAVHAAMLSLGREPLSGLFPHSRGRLIVGTTLRG